jgi:hypothetical protein
MQFKKGSSLSSVMSFEAHLLLSFAAFSLSGLSWVCLHLQKT